VSGETPTTVLDVRDRTAVVIAQALGFEAGGRQRYEVVVEDGRVVEIWPHAEPGKLKRADLEQLRL